MWNKIKIQQKITFFSAIIFGLISQGMGLFNKYSIHDDVLYMLSGDNPLPLGRWMLYLLIRMERMFFGDGNFSLPMINGTIAIICSALSICLLVDLFEIHSATLCLLLGGFAVSIPSVTSLFGYMYNAHFYSYALLLSVLGPYCILKKNKWPYFVLGIVMMVCSSAIYQAYIPVMLSTFLIAVIQMFSCAYREDQLKAVWKKTGIILLSCLIFISLYIFSLNFLTTHYGVMLSSHKGLNNLGAKSLSVYFQRILVAYNEFIAPGQTKAYTMFPENIRLPYFVLIALAFVFSGKILYSRRKTPCIDAVLALLILLVPLTVNFIFVMVDRSYVYSLMMYGQMMFFVFFAWVFERAISGIHSRAAHVERTVCMSLLGVLVLMYCRYDNTCYLKMALMQSETTRYYSTLVARIQSTEGYDSWKYVSYIGRPQPGRQDNSVENITELDHIQIYPYWGLQNAIKGNWREYMRIWCGYTAHEVDQSYFKDDPEVNAMPHYPNEGSIKVINDTVVVKF